MDKPGTHNITRGVLWLTVGGALTVGSLWLLEWQAGVVFYGAIFVGGIQIAVGVFQRIRYELLPEDRKKQKHAEASMVTLLRCMAMVANADGTVDDREIETIGAIYEKVTGSHPGADQIRAIVENVGRGGAEPEEFVASLGTQVPLDFRILIAKACALVTNADGEVDKKEKQVYNQILDGLALPRSKA